LDQDVNNQLHRLGREYMSFLNEIGTAIEASAERRLAALFFSDCKKV